jgi:hypothetical protein
LSLFSSDSKSLIDPPDYFDVFWRAKDPAASDSLKREVWIVGHPLGYFKRVSYATQQLPSKLDVDCATVSYDKPSILGGMSGSPVFTSFRERSLNDKHLCGGKFGTKVVKGGPSLHVHLTGVAFAGGYRTAPTYCTSTYAARQAERSATTAKNKGVKKVVGAHFMARVPAGGPGGGTGGAGSVSTEGDLLGDDPDSEVYEEATATSSSLAAPAPLPSFLVMMSVGALPPVCQHGTEEAFLPEDIPIWVDDAVAGFGFFTREDAERFRGFACSVVISTPSLSSDTVVTDVLDW